MNEQAVEVLYKSLGSLPMEDGVTLNLLPWAQESEETNRIKRKVCESIVSVLQGFMVTEVGEEKPPRMVAVQCRSCSTEFLRAPISSDGTALIPGPQHLQYQRSVECPHDILSLEDQRRKIEEALGG